MQIFVTDVVELEPELLNELTVELNELTVVLKEFNDVTNPSTVCIFCSTLDTRSAMLLAKFKP